MLLLKNRTDFSKTVIPNKIIFSQQVIINESAIKLKNYLFSEKISKEHTKFTYKHTTKSSK